MTAANERGYVDGMTISRLSQEFKLPTPDEEVRWDQTAEISEKSGGLKGTQMLR